MGAELHILTDTVLQSRWSHLELARMAFAGGADVVQYRHKHWTPAQLPELKALCALPGPGQCLLVNDDPALALAAGAGGVHLGQEDMAPVQARALLGPGARIGATVHTLAELEALTGAPIDYIGVGPVYGTTSKNTGLPPLGVEGLRRLAARSPWPVIAIGSIRPEHVPALLDAGAAGVAVISAFCLAPDPIAAAHAFREHLG